MSTDCVEAEALEVVVGAESSSEEAEDDEKSASTAALDELEYEAALNWTELSVSATSSELSSDDDDDEEEPQGTSFQNCLATSSESVPSLEPPTLHAYETAAWSTPSASSHWAETHLLMPVM